jgi:DNA-binding MarR family transcriptional regulator
MTVSVPRPRRSLSATELGAWRGLLRAHSALTKTLDAELEQAHGIALTSYEVLVRLDRAPGRRMRMCELADSVLLSRSGVTRLVDRLERDGLLAREDCAADARGAFAVLTGAGEQLLAEARETHVEGIDRHFLSRFTDEELVALDALLGRFRGDAR